MVNVIKTSGEEKPKEYKHTSLGSKHTKNPRD